MITTFGNVKVGEEFTVSWTDRAFTKASETEAKEAKPSGECWSCNLTRFRPGETVDVKWGLLAVKDGE